MNMVSTTARALGLTRRGATPRFERPAGRCRWDGAALVVMTVALMGCTTLEPVAGGSTELRQRIAAGELLRAGDRVVIRTHDGRKHRFAVTAVGDGNIQGKYEAVPIDEVASVQIREFSARKTTGLVIGIVLVGAVAGAAVAAAQVAPLAIFDGVP